VENQIYLNQSGHEENRKGQATGQELLNRRETPKNQRQSLHGGATWKWRLPKLRGDRRGTSEQKKTVNIDVLAANHIVVCGSKGHNGEAESLLGKRDSRIRGNRRARAEEPALVMYRRPPEKA